MSETQPSSARRLYSFWRPDPAPASLQAPLPTDENTPLLSNSTQPADARVPRSMTSPSTHDFAFVVTPPPNPGSFSHRPSPHTGHLAPVSASKQAAHTTRAKAAAGPSSSRPTALPAATTTAGPTPPTSSSTTPVLSRPKPQRSAATTTTPPPKPTQPSFLRRAADALDLNPSTSSTHQNAPPTPTHWTDHAHRSALLRLWDVVHVGSASSKYPISLTAQVVSTTKRMLRVFPELGEGDVKLGIQWVEYVLGVGLRQPFCTAERMGRWEVLAAGGGARWNWGPW